MRWTNEEIRKAAFEYASKHVYWEWNTERSYLTHKGYLETKGATFHNIKRARIDAYILDHYSVVIHDYDLLVGTTSCDFVLDDDGKKVIEDARKIIDKAGGHRSGIHTATTDHRVIDNEKLLRVGIKGIIEEIREKQRQLRFDQPGDYEAKVVYDSMLIDLEAVCRFAGRYRERLLELARTEEDPQRQQELNTLADIFARIPYEPSQTFYEAIQCVWFMQFSLLVVSDMVVTGRMDQYLYPFYQKDLEEGRITRAFALQLIEQLYFKINEVFNGDPISIMVGGVNPKGEPVWNEISYLCVEAIRGTGLVNPSVSVCYTEDMPEDLMELSMELIAKGYTRPAFFNDALIQKGLRNAGVSEEDARYYIHSNCVEITPIGASNILVSVPYINLCKALEYVLSEKKTPYVIGELPGVGGCYVQAEKEAYLAHEVDVDLDALESFDSFMERMKKVLSEMIEAHVRTVFRLVYIRKQSYSSPLASALINDCIERGKDSGAGGARYNYVQPNFPGVINLIDSLEAIRHAVYEEKVMTLRELAGLCATNFEGEEAKRQYLINQCAKFGNNMESVDEIGCMIYNFIYEELQKYTSPLGQGVYPGYFAFIFHGIIGELTGATPDGRKAGVAVSEHLGAFTGMDKNGPIAVMRSIAKLDQSVSMGGIATNYRFTSKFMASEKGKKMVADFIRTFMKNGCFEIQFNVVSKEDLLAAQENPEEYRTLIVRVAGYSDYFVNLPPIIQKEIIERTENGGF